MAKGDRERKDEFYARMTTLFTTYKKILVVHADNVGSQQFHRIRKNLRGKATLLMGKNTMMRKAVRELLPTVPGLEKLLPAIKGNVGLVFTNDDLRAVRDSCLSEKVPAAARPGAIAPVDVHIQANNTGMGPEKTSFFQALGIATKITKGTIEIVSDVHLVKKDQKVGASEATLLNMLKISPFTYGLQLLDVYEDGSLFSPSLLDITDEHLLNTLSSGIRNVAAISLQIGFPTIASVPHSIAAGYKNVLAIAIGTEYSFKQADKVKEILKNPGAFAAAAPAKAAAPAAAAPAKKEEPKKEEKKKEESDEDMGFGLFD